MMDEDKCWQAVIDRDKTKDGVFFYGVATTKVFCRPGCSSRLPLRKNVRFFRTAAEAQADGFRPCQRCGPPRFRENMQQSEISEIRQYIFNNLKNRKRLKLETLSKHFLMSPFHFQRKFKMSVGVTPRQYIEELRMQTFKEELRSGLNVTNATYKAGFGSSSRVYERVGTQLGMTPRQYRSGGKDLQISYATIKTPLGLIMIGATDRGLCFLEFGQSKSELLESLKHEYPFAHLNPLSAPFSEQYTEWIRALAGYLEDQKSLGVLPLALHGTAFQIKVWKYLQTIPRGSVQSYADVATAIGQPSAARAVAGACAANRIALVVPCHRVIRGDGAMGGYRWGLERKRALLDAERRSPKNNMTQHSAAALKPECK